MFTLSREDLKNFVHLKINSKRIKFSETRYPHKESKKFVGWLISNVFYCVTSLIVNFDPGTQYHIKSSSNTLSLTSPCGGIDSQDYCIQVTRKTALYDRIWGPNGLHTNRNTDIWQQWNLSSTQTTHQQP